LLTFTKCIDRGERKVEGYSGKCSRDKGAGNGKAKATNYFDLADYYLNCAHKPFNPMYSWSLGVGKINDRKGLFIRRCNLRSDEIRKEASGVAKDEHRYGSVAKAYIRPELTRQIYCTLWIRLCAMHGKSESYCDATI
jgi:hypothetical protein